MKKTAREVVLAAFTEALEACPREHLADLEDALTTYVNGDSHTAAAHLDRVLARSQRKTKS